MTANLSAQINQPLEKGYVVLLEGDTIRGFIYYESNNDLYKQVRFKKSLNSPLITFKPSSLTAFYLEASRQMFISGDLLKQFKQGYYSGSQGVFLKVLVRGFASLYYSNAKQTPYFVTKDPWAEVLQKGSKERKQIAGNYYEIESKPYVKKLQYLFSDCLKDTLSLSLSFSAFHLIKVVERYNTCRGVPSFKSGKKRDKIFLAYSAGVLNSGLGFEDKKEDVQPYGYPMGAPFGTYDLTPLTKEKSSSTAFFAGVGFSLYPGWNKHISLSSLVAITRRKWTASRVKLNLTYVDIPLSIRYNFNIGRMIQPVIGAGIDLALSVKSKYNDEDYKWSFHRESYRAPGDTYPSVMEVTMPSIFERELKPSTLTPFGSLGIAFVNNRSIVSLDFRMSLRSSVTKSPIYESSVTDQAFIITYTPIRTK